MKRSNLLSVLTIAAAVAACCFATGARADGNVDILGGRVRFSEAKLDNPVGAGSSTEVDAGGLTYGVNAGWTWQ